MTGCPVEPENTPWTLNLSSCLKVFGVFIWCWVWCLFEYKFLEFRTFSARFVFTSFPFSPIRKPATQKFSNSHMGSLCSSSSDSVLDVDLDEPAEFEDENTQHNILLLGPTEAGRSTIVKQFHKTFLGIPKDTSLYLERLQSSTLDNIQNLCQIVSNYCEKHSIPFPASHRLVNKHSPAGGAKTWSPEVCKHAQVLWEDPLVQMLWNTKRNLFSSQRPRISDNLPLLMKECKEILEKNKCSFRHFLMLRRPLSYVRPSSLAVRWACKESLKRGAHIVWGVEKVHTREK